jgi:hypothetical protein
MRTHYAKNKSGRNKRAEKFARMRAAKERKRIERANAPIDADALMAESVLCSASGIKTKRGGFRITIECLDDGEKASFTTALGPFGLTLSPTLCGRRVSCLLTHYLPIPKRL